MMMWRHSLILRTPYFLIVGRLCKAVSHYAVGRVERANRGVMAEGPE